MHRWAVSSGSGGDGRVEENDAAVAHLAPMLFVGDVVESDENVDHVPWAQDGLPRDASLRPSGPSENLGRESSEGESVETDAGGSPGEHFGGGDDSLAAFTRETDDDLTLVGHGWDPPMVANGAWSLTRSGARRAR